MDNFLEVQNAAYDKLAKRFLARKSILARILKYTVEEFADCSLEDIEHKYIEGDPTSNINSIPLDDTLDIKGKHTESGSPIEGLITFDIIFDAIAPESGEPIKLIINIEPQKTTKTIDYKLMKRAMYYSARLISSQKEKEFHGDDYNGLKKIYSIWICMDVQKYRADSIQEYRFTERLIHGKFTDEPDNYDLVRIVILNLGEDATSHELLNLLHLIFLDLKSSAEKEKILHDDYNLDITRDMKEELIKMGGLMEPLLNIAAKQAATQAATVAADESEKNTLLTNIRSLMETMKWSTQQAMDALKISPEMQKVLKPLI